MEDFSQRLQKAMNLRGIKQAELCELSGIDKSKVSSYLSGRYKAKQDGVYLLAKALNVNELWLMGYDIPMNKKKVPIASFEELSEADIAFFNDYRSLMDDEKQVLRNTLNIFLRKQGGK